MVVVGRGELVLDDDGAVAAEVVGKEVERERADRRLPASQLEVQAQRVSEECDVLGEPGGEVQRFVRPKLPQVDPPEDAELLHTTCLSMVLTIYSGGTHSGTHTAFPSGQQDKSTQNSMSWQSSLVVQLVVAGQPWKVLRLPQMVSDSTVTKQPHSGSPGQLA